MSSSCCRIVVVPDVAFFILVLAAAFPCYVMLCIVVLDHQSTSQACRAAQTFLKHIRRCICTYFDKGIGILSAAC